MNKLGITDSNKMWEIEYFLFNVKYHLIDECFTFNEESIFNVKYLEKIHLFLFNDLLSDNECLIREKVSNETIDKMNSLLQEIPDLIYLEDQERLKNVIYELWKEQIFYDGNTRTLLCFLKIISHGLNIDMNYDFTKDINKDYFINDVIDTIKIKEKMKTI